MARTPSDPDVVTDADVEAAETAAQEAQDLVAELENKVLNGDVTVTPEEIVAQESLGRFARLRAAATRRKAAKSKETARLLACEALYDDIDAHATDGGEHLATLLHAVEDAITAFSASVTERNSTIQVWRERALALDIPNHAAPVAPPTTHGRVGLAPNGRDGVIAGRRAVKPLDATFYLNEVLGKLKTAKVIGERIVPNGLATDAVYTSLSAVDAPAAESTASHFYHGPNGGIIAMDRPFSDDEIKRLQLTVITRQEAWGE